MAEATINLNTARCTGDKSRRPILDIAQEVPQKKATLRRFKYIWVLELVIVCTLGV